MLSELGKKATDAPEEYAKFWDNFGAVLKEGLYEDRDQRDTLLALARFRSTTRDGLVSLDEYVEAMKPGQDAIYTITGDNLDLLAQEPAARRLPRARGRGPADDRPDRRVLDPGDRHLQGKAVQIGDPRRCRPRQDRAAEDKKDEADKPEPPAKLGSLIAIFKLALGDAVKDVRSSERLTDSAVCLVADEGDMDMHLERLLKQHRQLDTSRQAHPRDQPAPPADRAAGRQSVGETGASDQLSEFAWLLLDQARIVEGEQLPDPPAFARRLATLLERGLPASVAGFTPTLPLRGDGCPA